MTHQQVSKFSGIAPRWLPKVTAEEALENALRFIGTEVTQDAFEKLTASAPVAIPDSPEGQFAAFTRRIARNGGFYNLVYCEGTRAIYPGVTLATDDLLEPSFTEELIKLCPGGFIRPNAVLGNGSGKFGCHRDIDIASHDYLLAESDSLPIHVQAAVLHGLIKMGMPIVSAVFTGGKSIHALIKVEARNEAEFRTLSRRTYSTLVRLGFDPSCSNPSRMTRLPGCVRTLSDGSTALQKLLYLA